MPKTVEYIPVVRHLKDIDNLVANGTDNPLAPGQNEVAIKFGNQLAKDAKAEGYCGVVLVTSPKRRTIETAQIIQEGILQSENGFKASLVVNHNLREINQGKLIFPSGYKPGDFFNPLSDAWRAFWSETFIDNQNLLYPFGSPYVRGELQHPELNGHFLSYGECYRDYAVRLYSAVYDFGLRLHNFRRLKPIVVTHDSPRVIFRELEFIGGQIQARAINITPGDLPQLTWDTYSTHEPSRLNFGEVSVLSTTALSDQKVLDVLKREIIVLKQLS